MRSSTREGKPQSSDGTENSLELPTPIEVSDASPNYMKGTTSSHAKDSFESTQGLLTKKTFTRMSTLKLKRSLTRKLTGKTEPKRKLKSSKSIKLATVKGPKSARSLLSESIYGSDGQNRKNTSDAGNKSQRVITRRLSLKPVRILAKMPTFNSRNSSMDSGTQMAQSQDTSLHKATCSSTLKDSHFPDKIDLPQEGSGSEGVSTMKKVCPYTYCSLHGHRHRDHVPPLKRFVSMRRRQLKTQKPMKMDGRSKPFGNNARKATQKSKTVLHSEGEKMAMEEPFKPRDTPTSTITEGGTSCLEEGEEKYILRCDAEVLLGETSFPHMIDFEEYLGNSLAVEGNTFLAVKETNMESCCIANENLKSDFEVTKKAAIDKNMDACKKNTVDSMSANEVILEGENMESDYVQEEPKPSSTSGVAYGMQKRDQKYIKMWHLMYKNAVLSNTGKSENELPVDGGDKDEREEDALAFNGVETFDDEKKNVVELVQKAFDEILLPETEDLSSDDHLKSRGNVSDEVLLEKGEDKREEGNAPTLIESPERTPKTWSHLKKLILWKRFVKALEKARKINPIRPRQLPSDANFEAEKVFLKPQTEEERKKAEEWMLDYALQKVISKLAPAQRQRVTLLVEAFETVLPFQDAENGQQSSVRVKPRANPIQSHDASSDHIKEDTDKISDYAYSVKTLLGKASSSDNSTLKFSDNASDNPLPELGNPNELKETCPDYPETETVKNMPSSSGAIEEDLDGKLSLDNSCNNGENISTVKTIRGSCEEAPSNQIVNENPEDLVLNLNTDNSNIKPESPGRYCETKDNSKEQFSVSKSLLLNGLVRSLRSNLVGSESEAPSKVLDEPTTGRKDFFEKDKLEMSAVVEPETKLEKESNKGLWYMVYKHMVSDMTENNSKSLPDGADEEESRHEESRTREASVPYESTPVINQDMHLKPVVADPEVELRQIEAIKMVEEAIDSILPDVEDNLPDNTISDNFFIQSEKSERMNNEGLNQKEEGMESGNGIAQEQEELASKGGDKPKQQLSRNWSNLKKVVLLRRFIKALEKVRKFNPRGPRYLPIEPDSEAEKVLLRHQDMAERKGTEEWMLDYALRQVVSKLTPARKRKVELLVEAFETVKK